MNLKVKKLHPEAKLPTKANPGDAGLDLTAIDEKLNPEFRFIEYDFGLSMEIEEGYVGLIFPRSSNSKKDLVLSNCVGVVDSSYRGPVTARFKSLVPHSAKKYSVGDKVAQLVILQLPKVNVEEVTELSNTQRGTGGYGSSGA